jgi:DNA-binding IclR family transcriptional regulator
LNGEKINVGKLLIAQLPWPKVQERIEQYGLPALTVNSVSDIDVLRKQLTCARQDDIAVEHGETVIGQSCLAMGIYERERRVIAALSICTPTETMHSRHEEYARVAGRAARTLSARIVRKTLGHRSPGQLLPTQRRWRRSGDHHRCARTRRTPT